jgi:NHLM bacteriocin system ABC transporter peptidase/ATP-binding protein
MTAQTGSRSARRVRTPTVLQMEAVECGAAALGIVLGAAGRFVSLEELRVACGVSRDGTKASNILKAARAYGLVGKGFSKQPADLLELPLPLIVFWNFNHFVVVEGFGGGKVYLNDPATGPRVVSDDEFGRAFTGVVLVFEPGPRFTRGGNRPGFVGPLLKRLRGSGSGLLYVVLVSLLLVLIGMIIPVFARVFVDYYLMAGFRGWLLPLLLGLALTALLRAGLSWLQLHALLRLETKLSLSSSYRFFQHVLHLPVEFFTQRYGGEVGGRVAINDRVARLLSRDLAANILNVVMASLYLVMMFSFNVPLTLVGLLFAGLNVLALRYVARHRRDTNMRLLQERGKLIGTAMGGLQAIETLKATGAESDFFARWAGQMAKVLTSEQRMAVSTMALAAVPTFLTAAVTAAILGLGSLEVMNGSMTVGMLVAFQSLMAGFLDPVNQLVGLGGTLQEVEGEMNRLDDVLRYPVDPAVVRPRPKGDFPARLSGELELHGVVYGHSRLEPPLIRGFGLKMKPGARVALIGPSGSGKTTLAKIVSGIHRPWEGAVLLDGTPADEIPREVVTHSVAVVDQEFFLFKGTVREVLTLWDSTVAEEDIIRAAKDACIHDDIAARPGGYDSVVEEGGANFSGGQRQRLEIARALVNNPSLVVLDEATSALDPVTESHIDENLRRRGCTCVIVAHRLSTIRDCDEIIVLDRGRIVERGTHEQLVAARGMYRALLES